jgi:hypothetical protein
MVRKADRGVEILAAEKARNAVSRATERVPRATRNPD